MALPLDQTDHPVWARSSSLFCRPLRGPAPSQRCFPVQQLWGDASRERLGHSPSTAFQHLPPNSGRIGYATAGALFISGQLSTNAVKAIRKVWVLIRLWKQNSVRHARKHEARPPRVRKKSSISILVLFVLAQATWAVIKETSDIILLVCYKLTAILAPRKNCPLADSLSRPMT